MPPRAPSPNPVVAKNTRLGSTAWRLPWPGYRRATGADEIAGCAAATSVTMGQSLAFKITANPADLYSVDVFRLGWYAGAGGRLVAH